ncbi:MAG: DUF1565 domain-containing protein [Clostridia bacterium]|nr:DUF1565 domain-containing protein [Clostridia bacterium]
MKKLISIILSVALVFSCFCVSVLADESEENLAVFPYQKIKYVKSTGILSGISPKTDVNSVLSCFENPQNITVFDQNGENATSGFVGTSWQFKKADEKATALIFGDVDGDGKIALLDLLKLHQYLVKVEEFSSLQQTAMDTDQNSKIDTNDCLVTLRHIANWLEIKNESYFYVSKTGNDSNNGSKEAPFLTISKAASVLKPGDTCIIDSGVYRETVIPANEGEKGAPISFMAKPGAEVTVSGTEKVTAAWTLYKDGIYKANQHIWRRTENQLFVDGKMAQIARFPNKNSDNFIATGDTLSANSASDSYAYDENLSYADGYFDGAKIFVEGTSHYIHYSSTVNSYKNKTAYFEKVDSGWDSPTTNSKFYFYDKLELLDAQNEWYYDGDGGLYYKPKANVNPNDLTFEYSVRPDAFDVRNKGFISIKGIEIFGANVKTNEKSVNLTLEDNKILYYYHTVQSRNYPWEANWYGVELWGKNSVVKNNEIAYSAEGGVEVYADNCSVVNNYIHDINYINSNAAAVEAKYANYTLVSHNTIDNIARTAIIANSENMRVCYNKISNCAVNMHDVSGIGTYKFDAKGTTEIDHNVIFDCNDDHAFVAYYLDNGSMNYLVHHNVCYDVDLSMILNNPNYNNKIYNNTFLSRKAIQTGNMQNPWENNAFCGAVWNGNQFYNNIMPSLHYGTGAYFGNNLLSTNKDVKFNADYTLGENSIAIGKGVETALGNESDIGAYKYGEKPFEAGHNFEKVYEIEFSLSKLNENFTPVKSSPFLELNDFKTDVIPNTSFENSTSDWGGSGYTNINSNASKGNWAVKIEGGWIEKTIDVTPGDMYAYKADIKVEPFGVTSEFGIHFMDDNYNILNQLAFMVTTTDYETFETVFTVPEGTKKMRIFVANWDSSKKVYVDDMHLLKK